MKTYVKFKIDARYVAEVEVDSKADTKQIVEEAKEKAMKCFEDADFGDAEIVDADPIIVENENGDFLWEEEQEES